MTTLFSKLLPLALTASLLAGCADGGGLNKQTGGAVLGGVGGGLLGAQFGHGSGKLAATAVGTLVGALVGSEVGRSLDRADQAAAQQAERRAWGAPVGQAIAWNNPDSGHVGTVTPIREGQDQAGNYCREFQSTVTIDGRQERAYGTACRQPGGDWRTR